MQTWQGTPHLGFGLGISVNHQRGFMTAEQLHQSQDIDLDYFEIYTGVRPIPDYALSRLRSWQDSGLPFTFHTASLDLWNLDKPDNSGIAPTCAIETFLKPHWCNQDLMLTRIQGLREGVLLAGVFTEQAARGFADRYNAVSSHLCAPLLIENAPYRLIVGDLDFGQFFSLFSNAANCGLTLDIGHLYATSLLMQTRVDDLLRGYPFDRVVEIHIAGGAVDASNRLYIDNHDLDLVPDVIELLREVIGLCPALKGVVYEVQSPEPEKLIKNIKQVIDIVNEWRYQEVHPIALERHQ